MDKSSGVHDGYNKGQSDDEGSHFLKISSRQ